MLITVNGDALELDEGSTVSELLESMGLTGKRLAVECNQEIVPKSAHQDTVLQNNDTLEIVHAIGGG
ncbi:MAG: sulfur carrier protein ThiS [Pseudomonadales bacterium]|nr:sulfur carrier protein ThiS [Pseudomonadales bacterium]